MEFGDPRLPKRFWAQVQIDTQNGCWVWTGGTAGRLPAYGRFGWQGVRKYVHRWVHFVLTGDDSSQAVDHICKNVLCCNPAPNHTRPGTHKQNVATSLSEAGRRARSSTCIHGHELSGANLYVRKEGYRVCVTCRRENLKKYRERRQSDRTIRS